MSNIIKDVINIERLSNLENLIHLLRTSHNSHSKIQGLINDELELRISRLEDKQNQINKMIKKLHEKHEDNI